MWTFRMKYIGSVVKVMQNRKLALCTPDTDKGSERLRDMLQTKLREAADETIFGGA